MFPARSSRHSPLKNESITKTSNTSSILLYVPGGAAVVVGGSEEHCLGPLTQVAHEPTVGQSAVKVQMPLEASKVNALHPAKLVQAVWHSQSLFSIVDCNEDPWQLPGLKQSTHTVMEFLQFELVGVSKRGVLSCIYHRLDIREDRGDTCCIRQHCCSCQ